MSDNIPNSNIEPNGTTANVEPQAQINPNSTTPNPPPQNDTPPASTTPPTAKSTFSSFIGDVGPDGKVANDGKKLEDGVNAVAGEEGGTVDPLDTVPESYAFTDNNGQPLSEEQMTSFQAPFKDAGLTSRQAQKMYDAFSKAQNQWVEQLQQQNLQMRQNNLEQIKADPQIGGQNINQTKAYVGTVMDKYGSQELRDFLNESGLGSNPELVRVFAKIGKDLSSDNFVSGRGRSNKESSIELAKRMYPKSPELWR